MGSAAVVQVRVAEISTRTEADEMEVNVLGLVMTQEGRERGFWVVSPRGQCSCSGDREDSDAEEQALVKSVRHLRVSTKRSTKCMLPHLSGGTWASSVH